ncbi:hypothetical protein [Antribacter gilvus]|uniref:hypothetical protein n=1 Tax=Antribacter gilvus TaxID=2304675 RepID=UPI000F7A22D4|nr:hypothetical protein [Antribacter gilvus]
MAPGSPDSASSSSGGTSSADVPVVREWRATPELCWLVDLDAAAMQLAESCADGYRVAYTGVECPDGQVAVGALFRQTHTATGAGDGWSAAELVEPEGCMTEVDITTLAAQAFASMAIQPSPLVVQPPDGWTLVNVDTITYTTDVAQDLDTVLLGTPVTIRAVPHHFTWDYGDGAVVSTEDPGAAWPDHTVAHAYAVPGETEISLTTTWRGQFRVAGEAAWRDVPGEATTTSSSGTIAVHEARTRLVEDTLP